MMSETTPDSTQNLTVGSRTSAPHVEPVPLDLALSREKILKAGDSPARLLSLMVAFCVRSIPRRDGIVLALVNLATLASALFPTALGVALTGTFLGLDVPAALGVGFFIVVTVVAQALRGASGRAQVNIATQLGFESNKIIAHSLSQVTTLDRLEDPAIAENLAVFRSRATVLGEGCVRTTQALVALAVPALLMIFAVIDHPQVILMVLGCVPVVWQAIASERFAERAENESAPHHLAMEKHRDAVNSGDKAAELASFGAADWYVAIYEKLVELWAVPGKRANLCIVWSGALAALGYFLCGAAVIWWTARDGDMRACAVVLLTVVQLNGLLAGLNFAFRDLSRAFREFRRFIRVCLAAEQQSHPLLKAPLGEVLVSCRGISYSYPGAAGGFSPGDPEDPNARMPELALSDVTVDIPAGALVALVGANGSGKSTLAMLLRGLREPTQGTLTYALPAECNAPLDPSTPAAKKQAGSGPGSGAADPSGIEWIAGIGQSPAHWELRAEEAALVPQRGDWAPLGNETFALTSSGAAEVISGLPQKGQTQIGDSWDNPCGLSGGQWQRLGNARGLLGTDRARLTIVDEPTSALDAFAEARLVSGLRSLVTDSKVRGSVVVVTHRIATALAADYVIMLDAGRVIATGTPAELAAGDNPFGELVAKYQGSSSA